MTVAAAVTPLADATDPAWFGGKASQLAAALRAGLPVPDGVALPWPLVAAIAAGDPGACESLDDVLERLGGAVAVRSSAVGEDSSHASFAGVHATRLNVVDAASLREAVAEVAGSATSDGALAYRATRGGGEARMAVVVQRFLDADVSGVLFTRHPVTGADERVVEASWGLGEAIVGGLVTPDHMRLSRAGRLLELRLGEKDVAVRARAGGGTEEVALDEALASRPALDDAQVRRLLELAAACEALREEALDLEWCFARGRPWLLQQRPVTTRARVP